MLPGPDYIYKCPQCGQLISRGSLRSGNTLGAKFFSDTKRIAPMLPEFSQITICPKCNTIFWLSKAEEVGTKDKYTSHSIDGWEIAKIEKPKWWWGKRKRKEYNEKVAANQKLKEKQKEEQEKFWGKPARFLQIDEYVRAINNKEACTSQEEEFALRLSLWHAFNDRTRAGKVLFENNKEKEQWEDNCLKLINIFESKETVDSELLIAELKRNLGQFEDAIILLNGIYRKKLWWAIDQIKEECEKKNALVFQLDTSNSGKKDTNPTDYKIIGEDKEKSGDYQGALAVYDQAILDNPTDTIPYILKAGVYDQLSNQEAVLECLNKAIAINPKKADAYFNRALYHRHNKNFKEAQADYDKALSFEPCGMVISLFNEEDMVKYSGKITEVNYPQLNMKRGTLYIELYLSPNPQGDSDTAIFVDDEHRLYSVVLSLFKKQEEEKDKLESASKIED